MMLSFLGLIFGLERTRFGARVRASVERQRTAAAMPRTLSILLIEHDMSLVFRFAERITVMVSGAELISGTPAEIAADTRVQEVYLGKSHG